MATIETQPERDVLVRENRIGIFKISRALLEQAATNLLEVLADVLVIDVTYSYSFPERDVFCFKAYSPRFDPVKEADEIPVYLFVIDAAAEGAWTHSVERARQEKP